MPEISGRGGPFLKMAFLCERALQERDGVFSFVRVIDRITHNVQAPDVETEEFEYSLFVVLNWVSGDARGRHAVHLRIEGPNGISEDLAGPIDIQFEGNNRGAGLVAQTNLKLRLEGVHWILVSLDGETQTQMPLEVWYQRANRPKGSSA